MASSNKRVVGFLLLCSFLLLSGFHVDGFQEDISLTKDEELEIENELQHLNKPALKTVKTSYGDLYDCVDFYKQPAFDNPLLKNHTYYPGMRPSGHRSVSKSGDTISKHGNIKFEKVDCPSGTVPIRRVTKEELVRTKLYRKRYASTHGALANEPNAHLAITLTKPDPNKKYHGGSAWISVYNVTIPKPNQYSLARLRVQSNTDFIEVGTQTNPVIYNNLDTHIFLRTKTSNEDSFNLQTKSFVQVLQGSPVDMRVTPVSERGVQKVNGKFSIERDDDSGNWWFYLEDGMDTIMVGFWPPASFTGGLQGLATSIDWGGEVGPNYYPSAPMGSGYCPEDDSSKDAYCMLMKVVSDQPKQEIDVVDTETFYDSRYYSVIDRGVVSSYDGHVMYFGGPGEQGLNCRDS